MKIKVDKRIKGIPIAAAALSLTASSGATTLTESYYWSSTEFSSDYAWILNVHSGFRGSYGKSYNNIYVRPVVKY